MTVLCVPNAVTFNYNEVIIQTDTLAYINTDIYIYIYIYINIYIYTSVQRYGVTTTNRHLREFDRYLLFLIVCTISERNTVDFIDPLRNQIEWPNTVSIVRGPLRLKRRKKVSYGAVI